MKNFMKRAALLLLMIISAFPVWAEVLSGSCGENATYILDTESGLLKIEGEGPMTDYFGALRPWNDYLENIRRVEVSNGITVISGFMECPNLQSVEIPNSVTFIAYYAFGGCTNLSAVQLPNSLMSIGPSAFAGCSNLSEITIPESVTQVDYNAFYGCFVTKDNYHNNSSCVDRDVSPLWEPTLCDLEQEDGLLIKDNEAVHFRPWATSISIPEGVTANFSSLMSRYTFLNGDLSLTSINIPASFSGSLYGGIFHNAPNLLSVNISNDNQVYCSIDGVLYDKEQTMLLECPRGKTSITIPNTVTIIDYAALSMANLTSVTIPSSVTYIGSEAFADCSSLTSITLPNSVTSIESYAFENCSGLTSITIPESVTKIGEFAFSGCSGLTSITIPNSVTSIEGGAFYNCSGLTSITCMVTTPPVCRGSVCFYNVPKNVTLYVPEASIDAYKAAYQWKNFGNIEAISTVSNIVDGEEFNNTDQKQYETLTYTRTFTNTDWQALYVPFSMSYEDWADDFEVAAINDVHQWDDDDDGNIDRTALEVVKVKSGSIEPNTPYLIKAKTTGEKTITFSDATLYKTEENSFDVSSWKLRFNFYGTYTGVAGSTMLSEGYYAMGGGKLQQAESSANALSPMRWYMSVTDRQGNPVGIGLIKVMVFGEDEDWDDAETTIKNVNESDSEAPLYDLSGRRVEKAMKGLYIKNGKKVLVK